MFGAEIGKHSVKCAKLLMTALHIKVTLVHSMSFRFQYMLKISMNLISRSKNN